MAGRTHPRSRSPILKRPSSSTANDAKTSAYEPGNVPAVGVSAKDPGKGNSVFGPATAIEHGTLVTVEVSTAGKGIVAKIDLPFNTTIAGVKNTLSQRLNMPVPEQQLVADVAILNDGSSLAEIFAGSSDDGIRLLLVRTRGHRAVSGGADGTLRLWDLTRGQCLRTLQGHKSWVQGVDVDWEQMMALSASDDFTLRLWNLETGVCQHALCGHTASVLCLVADWAGKRALSGSYDRCIRVWDLASRTCSLELKGHTGRVQCIAVDWLSERILSGSGDGSARLWDAKTGICVQKMRRPGGTVCCVSVDWESNLALTGSMNGYLRLWSLDRGECLQQLVGHAEGLLCMSVDWKSCAAVTGGEDGTLSFWDFHSDRGGQMSLKKNLVEWTLSAESIWCMYVDWSQQCIVSGSGDGLLRKHCLKLMNSAPEFELRGHVGRVHCLAVQPA